MLEPILTMFAVCCRGYFAANQHPATIVGGTFCNSSFVTGVLMAYSAAARMAKMMDLFVAFIFLIISGIRSAPTT